jgi:DnaK suppressor protein
MGDGSTTTGSSDNREQEGVGPMSPLTCRQEQKLKCDLERQRAERLGAAHERLLGARQEHYAVLAGEGPDAADQASAEQLAAFENTMAQRHAAAVRHIDAALIRIEEHSFSYCVDCGENIGFQRLSVYPTATRCVHCQEHHDRLYGHGKRPTL